MAARLGAILWICCLQFFIAERVTRSSWISPYSFRTNFISDLGTAVSPWHALMNASFILQGLLIGAGALLWWSRRRSIGLALLTLCGIGVIVVGAFPSDASHGIHVLGAATHFLTAGLGMIFVGWTLPKEIGWASMAAGVVIVTATILLGMSDAPFVTALGAGTVERIGAYLIAGGMAALGFYRLTNSHAHPIR